MSDFVEKARRAQFARKDILDLEAMLRAEPDANQLIEAALPLLGSDSAAALLIAGSRAGRNPRTREIRPLLLHLRTPTTLALVVAAYSGDRVAFLVEVIQAGALPIDLEVRLLSLAIVCLGQLPVPPVIRSRLRVLARARHCTFTACLLGAVADRVDDPWVRSVARSFIPAGRVPEIAMLLTLLEQTMRQGPTEASLPPEPQTALSFPLPFPVDRPKPGRNDACPCGSGQKFKKCCEGKAERVYLLGPPSRDEATRAASRVDVEVFVRALPEQMALLEFEGLPVGHLARAFGIFVDTNSWHDAERALDVLERKSRLPRPIDEYRNDLIENSLDHGAFEVSVRQVARIRDPRLMERYALDRAFMEKRVQLADVEAAALQASQDSTGSRLMDLAYAIFHHMPALGILVARAALSSKRDDNLLLMNVIEIARDRLLLAPDDPAWDIFEILLDKRMKDTIKEAQGEVIEKQRVRAEELRAETKQSAARIADLERQLREARERVVEVAPPVKSSALAPVSAAPLDAQEAKRLRAKIEELKAEVEIRNAERRKLRSEYAELAKELSAHQPSVPEASDEDNEEEAAPAPKLSSVLVPTYSARATSALRELPTNIGRKSLAEAAALAGGDQDAWHSAKRLKRLSEVWSVRIGGRYHRLLFRPNERAGQLEVLDLVQRRDLEAAIRRLG